ncbi:uncharacterized protein LOC119075705 [Bradysia coprophila]|uniref:uncharacterized protein LOC119075705 n=1 Tax=Bradysia coprophila TaxID=38358 RepID=UPI00187DC2A4|nr:uncharacterized protein LOC119075705 [Bradysia coprophila]
MKAQIGVTLATFTSLILAVPIPQNDSRKQLVKRGIFDSITHFPFLASSSSAHGSSSSSSSSSSDDDHDFHSHVIHHPELHDFGGHHDDFSHDHNFAVSYQNQYFGHGHSHEFPTSYHEQHLFDDHLSDVNKFGSHDPLLDFSHLDAPNHIGEKFGHFDTHIDDYNNYGGDLGQYSNIHAGYLDISDDRKIDNLLDPLSPSHSSYDSY